MIPARGFHVGGLEKSSFQGGLHLLEFSGVVPSLVGEGGNYPLCYLSKCFVYLHSSYKYIQQPNNQLCKWSLINECGEGGRVMLVVCYHNTTLAYSDYYSVHYISSWGLQCTLYKFKRIIVLHYVWIWEHYNVNYKCKVIIEYTMWAQKDYNAYCWYMKIVMHDEA